MFLLASLLDASVVVSCADNHVSCFMKKKRDTSTASINASVVVWCICVCCVCVNMCVGNQKGASQSYTLALTANQ